MKYESVIWINFLQILSMRRKIILFTANMRQLIVLRRISCIFTANMRRIMQQLPN